MRSSRMQLFLHWIPALIGIGIIFGESTLTMSASNTSRWLYPIWVHLFGPVTPARWAVIHHYIRKCGHFAGYGTISLTFYYGWATTLLQRIRDWATRFRQSASLALLCTLILASWDEWHQSFLPGRTSSARDVVLDCCGAVVAHLALLAILWIFRRKPPAMIVQVA